jgi:hypothetical protein
MSLSYTKYVTTTTRDNYGRVIRECRERKTFEVTAPRDWAMYTPAGDRSLRLKAERLLAKVEKVWASDDSFNVRERKVRAALVSFVASWERMSNSAAFAGASDTAVRECVGSFHDKVALATFCDEWDVSELWDKTREASWKRSRKAA